MPEYSILFAPSEGKKPGGNPFAPDMFDYRSSNTFNFYHALEGARRHLIDTLHRVINQGTEMGPILGVKGVALEKAISANLEIYHAPLMAALDRYGPGVMYKATNFSGLPTGAQRRLLEHGIIFSGLFGLLRPDDLIPRYKLKIDASIPGIGKVSQFWRPHISKILNNQLTGTFVWNLLPKAHQEAWEDQHVYREMILVRFFEEKKGERVPVTHNVKTLRGQLINYIVREVGSDLTMFEEWRHPSGYKEEESERTYYEATKTRTLTFVKKT